MKTHNISCIEVGKEHPIIFGTESVKAILEGRKTQTRRVIKPQPINADYWTFHQDTPFNGAFYPNTDNALPKLLKCPYGQVGDRLWVKETWWEDSGDIYFKVDCPTMPTNMHFEKGKWKSALFMPRKFSRINLEITGLRVERLQEITGEDAITEGFLTYFGTKSYDEYKMGTLMHSPISQFTQYWDSLNAKRGYGWETNPWVWVIEFKILQ